MKNSIINNLFEFDNNYLIPIIGTDEAGRGPAVGPVYSAAVFFPKIDNIILEKLLLLNDSKKLTEKKREFLYNIIKENSINSIKFSTVEEIKKYNILNASLLAMKRACEEVIEKINISKFKILVDGNKLIKQFEYPQECIIKGDGKSASIAAASILAKVERDRFMKTLAQKYPYYDWENNKGYLTKKHIEGLKKHGKTDWHREKFLRNFYSNDKNCTIKQTHHNT